MNSNFLEFNTEMIFHNIRTGAMSIKCRHNNMGRLEFLGTINAPDAVPAPLAPIRQCSPHTFDIGYEITKKIGTDNLNINTNIEHTNITTEMTSEIEFSMAEFNAHNTLCIK